MKINIRKNNLDEKLDSSVLCNLPNDTLVYINNMGFKTIENENLTILANSENELNMSSTHNIDTIVIRVNKGNNEGFEILIQRTEVLESASYIPNTIEVTIQKIGKNNIPESQIRRLIIINNYVGTLYSYIDSTIKNKRYEVQKLGVENSKKIKNYILRFINETNENFLSSNKEIQIGIKVIDEALEYILKSKDGITFADRKRAYQQRVSEISAILKKVRARK